MKTKPVSGFPGYWITDTGRVLSGMEQRSPGGHANGFRTIIHRNPIRELKQTLTNRYFVVGLHRENTVVLRRTHHLVLETFVGPRPKNYLGRHLDGNTANNTLANLAWSTHSENALDRRRHGTW